MTFDEYLVKHRIDKPLFAKSEPARLHEWEAMYAEMHPNSFYISVKMMLNDVRNRYHLKEVPKPQPAVGAETAAARPVVSRRAAPRPQPVPVSEAPNDQISAPASPVSETAIPDPTTPALVEPATLSAASVGDAENTATDPLVIPDPAPKPSRPRPVFKKPAPPAETTSADIPASSENPALVTASEESAAAKPARPRPVFKHPEPAVTSSETQAPPAQETPVSAESPVTAAPAEAEPVKPPRPRPVYKRPTPTEPAAQSTSVAGQLVTEPSAHAPESPTQPSADTAEPPKPPRPRPVMRRPTPPPAEEGPAQS